MTKTTDHRTDATWVALQHAPLDVGAADAFLRTPAAGGITLFVGTTRQWTGGEETAELEYECYEAMALKEMQRLAEAARAEWPVERLVILHRLGVVPLAEASVAVGVATPHRDAAFEASRYLIDTLKAQVPIWKREVYADGRTEWVQNVNRPADR